jgi:hypothetical protein
VREAKYGEACGICGGIGRGSLGLGILGLWDEGLCRVGGHDPRLVVLW